MSEIFSFVHTLLTVYLIPFVLAIGVIYLIFGIVNYFIIGPGEEPKREEGRHQLLWTFLFFLAGLLLFALVSGMASLVNWASSTVEEVNVSEETRVQRVPNVPKRNN